MRKSTNKNEEDKELKKNITSKAAQVKKEEKKVEPKKEEIKTEIKIKEDNKSRAIDEKSIKSSKENIVKDDKTIKMNKKEAKSKIKMSSKIAFAASIIVIVIILGLIAYVTNTIIKKQQYSSKNPVVTIEIKDYGTVTVELYPQYAPNTVKNFITLANNGFYNGLTFHRTIPDFMIQGGDPNGDGSGNAKLSNLGEDSTDSYAISGEFILNGFTQNTLRHKRGVISMARSDYSSYSSSLTKKGYDSASCQFFIMTADNTSLDGSYAAFGEVTDGMDIVDKISNLDVQTRDSSSTDTTKTANKPLDPPVITSITVETYGIDYGKPTTVTPFDYYSYMMQQYYGSSSATN